MYVRSTLLCFFISVSAVFGQDYSYSYQGNLSPENQNRFVNSCKELPQVISCKILQKEAVNGGEIRFSIKPTERAELDAPFTPIDIKAILIEFGLEPKEFIEIKPSK